MRPSVSDLERLIDVCGEPLALLDAEGSIRWASAAWERALTWRPEDLIGRSLVGLVVPDQADLVRAALASLARGSTEGTQSEAELELRVPTGTGAELELVASLRCAGDRICLALHSAAGRLAGNGQLDALTWLPNRAALTRDLERRLQRSEQRQDMVFAVLFVDLDGFKRINDTMGHEVGDQLLREVAVRLREAVRPGDTIARLGGDEFGVVLAQVDGDQDVLQIGDRVARAIAEPVRLHGRSIRVTASVGATLYQPGDQLAEDLLRRADRAMYAGKTVPGSVCSLYDAAAALRDQRQRRLDAEIEDADHRGELEVVYQPRFSLASRRVEGFQALLRWHHPELGVLAPVEFLHLAEQRGKLPAIESWLLRQSAAMARSLSTADDPCFVSANLGVASLARVDLGEHLEEILAEAGLVSANLQLEVREEVLFEQPDRSRRVAEDLAQRGIRLYVDGFGVGRSSLAALHGFSLAGIKIDHRFVGQLPDPWVQALLRVVLQLAGDLDFDVVPEGIETREQLTILGEMGFLSAEGSDALPGWATAELRAKTPSLFAQGREVDLLNSAYRIAV